MGKDRWGAGPALFTSSLLTMFLSCPPARSVEAPAEPVPIRRAAFLNLYRQHAHLPQARVSDLLGQPQRKTRQIMYRRYVEQWIYDPPLALAVEFDCPRGREPRLLSVHLLTHRKR